MDRAEVAVATITLARDDKEAEVLLSAIQELARLGIAVFATDGGSRRELLDALAGIPNVTLCESSAQGLWPQARASVRAALASSVRFILYTEPDKRDFFRQGLAALVAAARDDDLGIVLASRSAQNMRPSRRFSNTPKA